MMIGGTGPFLLGAVLVVLTCRGAVSLSSQTVRITTFNTNLLRQVSFLYPERKAALISSFNGSAMDKAGAFLRNGDLVCLQEVGEAADVRALREAAKQRYPYSLSALDKRFSEDAGADLSHKACAPQLVGVASCVSQRCSSLLNQTGPASKLLLVCALRSSCGLQNLSQTCVNCLSALGFGQTAKCLTETKATWQTTHGLLLLSRYHLARTKVTSFRQESTFNSRGYLSAEVDLLGVKFKVLCAHSFPVISQAYAGPFPTSAEENLNETHQILHEVSSSPNVIILGDLNTSPNLTRSSIHAAHSASYNLLAMNHTNTYVRTVGKCTFCPSNWLNRLVNWTYEEILDHIFLRTTHLPAMTTMAERVADDIAFNGKISGATVPSPLSDHFGVTVILKKSGASSISSPMTLVAIVIGTLVHVCSFY